MTQLDDMDFIAVSIQRERRDLYYQLQGWAGSCNSPNQRLFSRWFDTKSGGTSRIFNCPYSVFFWHLLLLEQMTKEVPGIRPAVISTETGTRLDEYRRFRHVIRNRVHSYLRPYQTWEPSQLRSWTFCTNKSRVACLCRFSRTLVCDCKVSSSNVSNTSISCVFVWIFAFFRV